MDDESIREQIEALVAEEHRLLNAPADGDDHEQRHARLESLKVELDRCWDLLRQREAHEEFGLDPNDASVRDADTVEGYEQ